MNLSTISFTTSNEPIGRKPINSNSSEKTNLDRLIQSIHDQIEKIHKNKHYDEDTKKIKIEELKTQLRELEKAKMLESSLSPINNENNVKKKENIKTNIHGDTLEIGMDIIKAGVSLDNLRNISATKTGLQGKSNLLASEIKIDKGRGLNTERKEEELSKIKDGINRTNDF